MAAPKIVWKPKQEEMNLHEKEIAQALIRRLSDLIIRDESNAKKAAVILEQWLKKTKP